MVKIRFRQYNLKFSWLFYNVQVNFPIIQLAKFSRPDKFSWGISVVYWSSVGQLQSIRSFAHSHSHFIKSKGVSRNNFENYHTDFGKKELKWSVWKSTQDPWISCISSFIKLCFFVHFAFNNDLLVFYQKSFLSLHLKSLHFFQFTWVWVLQSLSV